jgi:hypothetical protein
MSTTRVPPTRVFISTKAGMVGGDFADDRRFAPSGCARIAARTRPASAGDDREQLAFVGDVKRIEPENFARAFDFLANRDARFVEQHADARAAWAISRQRAGDAAARRVAQDVDVPPAASIASTRPFSGAVSLAISVSNSSPSRTDMMAMPCTAIWPAEHDLVAGPRAFRGAMFTPIGTSRCRRC